MDELRPEPHHLAIGSLRVNAWRQKKNFLPTLECHGGAWSWSGKVQLSTRSTADSTHIHSLPTFILVKPTQVARKLPTLQGWLALDTSVNRGHIYQPRKTLWYGINITGLLVDLHNWCMDLNHGRCIQLLQCWESLALRSRSACHSEVLR